MSEFLDRMAPFVIETGSTEILADTYEYRIVRNGFEPRLPGFVGLVGKVLFIASITPAEYREYIFWHEVMCVAKNDRKNCADTVRAELERTRINPRGLHFLPLRLFQRPGAVLSRQSAAFFRRDHCKPRLPGHSAQPNVNTHAIPEAHPVV